MVSDFASEYGIRLWLRPVLGYREFRSLLTGLLSADSRVFRFFDGEPPDPEPEGGDL